MLLQDVVDVDGLPESLLVVMDAIFFQRFVLFWRRSRFKIIMKLGNSCCLHDKGHWMTFCLQ